MKKLKLLVIVMITAGLFHSCNVETITASGDVINKEINISDYTALKVSDAFNVFVTFSETNESIILVANEDVQKLVVIEKQDDDLIIGLKKSARIRGNATLEVYIQAKTLSAFDINGAAKIILENQLSVPNLSISLSGSSDFDGALQVEELYLKSNGASESDLSGTVKNAHIALSGSSELRDFDLNIQTADLRLSGASDAYIAVIKNMEVIASGASRLIYRGDADIIKKKLSGSSQLIKKE
ncbi:head GIN domain-containing protein [Maribacter sp. 2-571]|uniref:head GIN domain-containing protein n=1 Tax=Maribacter sp. 2-571 TaxID=3417569 RepID=UPI003D359259